ncbi:hypothetical protein M8C21_005993 [Ambrosia artemisiifolia]|uniref:Protein EARLY FLOWERING 4 domain-containing protein n=1 Tax=Ambrosia artemisiifolia TaxID=4212 RepID=A0AAD5G3R8_AMBAR|nr:hypothetical protein M8C21_005993 [Ambrosia artemisiifolia]
MFPDVEGKGDGKVLEGRRFEKSFVEVERILDQNRVLINEINQNQESRMPDNLGRNVGLIRELNNNITKVVHLYSLLSSYCSNSNSNSNSRGFNTQHEEY